MKRTGPTNPTTKKIIEDMRTQGYAKKSKFMIKIMEELSISTRKRASVNLTKLQRICNENETIMVPGKVLSYGILTKPLTVSALSFSKQAEDKIKKSGGKIMSIPELVEKNPTGTKVRVIK